MIWYDCLSWLKILTVSQFQKRSMREHLYPNPKQCSYCILRSPQNALSAIHIDIIGKTELYQTVSSVFKMLIFFVNTRDLTIATITSDHQPPPPIKRWHSNMKLSHGLKNCDDVILGSANIEKTNEIYNFFVVLLTS